MENIFFFQDKVLQPFGYVRHLAICRHCSLSLLEMVSFLYPEACLDLLPFLSENGQRSKRKISPQILWRAQHLLIDLARFEYPLLLKNKFFLEEMEEDETFILVNARHVPDVDLLKKTIEQGKKLSLGDALFYSDHEKNTKKPEWFVGKFSLQWLRENHSPENPFPNSRLKITANHFFNLSHKKNLGKVDDEIDEKRERTLMRYAWEFLYSFRHRMSQQNQLCIESSKKKDLYTEKSKEKTKGVYAADGVHIHPTAIFLIDDKKKDLIVLEKGAKVGPYCVLEGPVYLAEGAELKPYTHISCSAIGKKSKVGGEVMYAVMDDYSNKVHSGFLGHSWIGCWVNVGAGTQFSNLRNTYTPFFLDKLCNINFSQRFRKKKDPKLISCDTTDSPDNSQNNSEKFADFYEYSKEDEDFFTKEFFDFTHLQMRKCGSKEQFESSVKPENFQFAGSLVGDFVKIAVINKIAGGSLIHLGSTINDEIVRGIDSEWFTSFRCVFDKDTVPPFYWGIKNIRTAMAAQLKYEAIDFPKFLYIQSVMFARRNVKFTKKHMQLFYFVYLSFFAEYLRNTNAVPKAFFAKNA